MKWLRVFRCCKRPPGSATLPDGNGKRSNNDPDPDLEGQETPESQAQPNLADIVDDLTTQEALDGANAKEQEMLERIKHLVDEEYDFLLAEALLAELEDSSKSGPRWDAVLSLPVFQRFRARMQCFTEVGDACFADKRDWFMAYEDSTKTRTIHGMLDPADGRQLSYRVRAQIPTSLRNAVAVTNEIELLPEWNKLVVGAPEVVGRRTAHYLVLNYQMSFLGGFQKVDICNEIFRYSDVQGGFLAEHIESVPEGHPSYRAPKSGCVRPQTLLRNCWVACGPEQTVFLQAGKLTLPFAVPRWLASKIGGVAGRFILEGLVRNSLRSTMPGNPWEELLKADQTGFYSRVGECIESQESQARTPPSSENIRNSRVADFDLRPQFVRRSIQRMDRPSTTMLESTSLESL